MTEEGVQALLKNAAGNLNAARLLLDTRHLDAAASRAYYAMFHVAQALLAHRGQSYSKHAAVTAAFGRDYAKAGILDATHHRRLIDAQDLRKLADYTAEALVTGERVCQVCGWADEFLSAARKHLTGTEGGAQR